MIINATARAINFEFRKKLKRQNRKKKAAKARESRERQSNKIKLLTDQLMALGQTPEVYVAATPQAKHRRRRASKDFYKSGAWLELRYNALVLHKGECQCCGKSKKDGVIIHVDHIKPRSLWPELELELSNLQILCAECNLGKLNRDITDWR
jgi:5-methylcytosine-specific restriction endonuclease McrA